jgi:selenocysteine lyase/cysteine desulfurase
VDEFLPWYGSVHRGAGFRSVVSTGAYEEARGVVREFIGARPGDAVLFTRNTTDSINLLARALPVGTRVVGFDAEHHADMLPWRLGRIRHVPTPDDRAEVPDVLSRVLSEERRLAGITGPLLVAVTGASNVTGDIWPIREIAAVAKRHGARIFVDAAQLAPHAPIDMTAAGVDYLAFSGHKLYAPFGTGVLVGRADWLEAAAPYLRGGGAVEFVTLDDALWRGLPDRHEAGSPNVIGAVALAAACRTLAGIGMELVAAEEAELAGRARMGLAGVPGLKSYELWGEGGPRIGVATFNVDGFDHALLAAVLSAEHGIGVRHGCFCAHPLLLRLLGIPQSEAEEYRTRLRRGAPVHLPGAVRMSLGLDSTAGDVDRLVGALQDIVEFGPRWRYERDERTGEYSPVPDPRQLPPPPFPAS